MSADIGQRIQDLYRQFGEIPGITIEIHKSLIAVNILNDAAEATIFLQGAQISHFKSHHQPSSLWLSPECDYQMGQSLRGGIPICWPWFGQLNKNPIEIQSQVTAPDAPTHGFVRERDWQLDRIDTLDTNTTRASLSLSIDEGTEPLWPFKCRIELDVIVADSLSVTFRVFNLSEQTFHYSTALHSYYAVENINQVAVTGLDNSQYLDCLHDWQSQTQLGKISIDKEVDRLYYHSGNDLSIENRKADHHVRIKSKNSHSAVLWNPWIEKSKRLSAFADDAYQHMLCIETANAGNDFVSLAAGHQHELGLTISHQSE